MLSNFITIAYRNLFRHKVFSFINVMGLAIGIASSILLLSYVNSELSFDNFHADRENIYRIRLDSYSSGVLESSGVLGYSGAAPAIKENCPEVLSYVRLHRADGMYTYHNDAGQVTSYHETKAFYADSTFLSVFDFELLAGKRSHFLHNPKSMAISESAARKYFGSENPIGKSLTLTTEWEGGEYLVESVFKDVPENSHLKFDFLLAIESLLGNNQFENGAWYWWNFYTYLLLRPGIDPTNLEQKFARIIETHLGHELKKTNSQEKFILQPLPDIHLHSNLASETEVSGNYKTVSALLIISFFIISIAWLNYINLSTAKAIERAREVGVRKLLGSTKRRLIIQFLIESAAITTLAIMFAAILVIATLPFFTQLIGKKMEISFSDQPTFWLMAFGIILIGTFLSGFYPALFLSSFQPLVALKGKILQNSGRVSIRRLLVIFQFGAAALLIVSTFTIYRQLQFMRTQDLGMNIEQKLIIRAPRIIEGESFSTEIDYFKNKVKTEFNISDVSASSEVPGKEIFWSNEFRLRSEAEGMKRIVNILAVDEDYIPTFGMTLLAGRNFSKDRASDFGGATIINESALRVLGFTSAEAAINTDLVVGEADFKKIIGVVKDFHQQSLKEQNRPTMINYIPWQQNYLTVSVSGHDLRNTVSGIEKIYRNLFPENGFEYFFLDEQFNRQYQVEEMEWKLLILFSVLSIMVASMGLFGLSSFLTIQRSKEVAVRKVLGASVSTLTLLLSKDFILLVLSAFVLTIPLAWFLMKQWLESFAYHIDVPWWSFVVSAVITSLIAFITISYQTIKTALTNPVESLRTE